MGDNGSLSLLEPFPNSIQRWWVVLFQFANMTTPSINLHIIHLLTIHPCTYLLYLFQERGEGECWHNRPYHPI